MIDNVENIISILKTKHARTPQKIAILDKYKCQMCGFILSDPHQAMCGCLFCRECVESSPAQCCPGGSDLCRAQNLKNSIRQDKARAREVSRMMAECVFDRCTAVIELNKMGAHLGQCKFKTNQYDDAFECPLRTVGCEAGVLSRQGLDEHLRRDAMQHNEILVQCTEGRNERIENLKARLKELIDEIDGVEAAIGEAELRIKSNIDQIGKISPRSLASQHDDDIIWRGGEFLWRIENFRGLRDDARSGFTNCVESEPFYSSEFGYKLCLKVYPNGDGPGRGTHLSLFFAILRGHYDHILQWPFTQRIRLSVHSGANFSLKYSEVFKPDAKSDCYEKPVNESNVGSGNPMFLLHNDLERNYILDGAFFVKAVIQSD